MRKNLYLGMKINMKGVTRIVLEFSRVVVKIPNFTCQWSHFLKGIIANIHEKQTWRWNSGKYETGKSHLLCPVVWASWGGWLLVMKKARPLSWEEYEKIDDLTSHTTHFPGDDTMSNYGYLDGKLVKLDYGDLNHWSEDYKK